MDTDPPQQASQTKTHGPSMSPARTNHGSSFSFPVGFTHIYVYAHLIFDLSRLGTRLLRCGGYDVTFLRSTYTASG